MKILFKFVSLHCDNNTTSACPTIAQHANMCDLQVRLISISYTWMHVHSASGSCIAESP